MKKIYLIAGLLATGSFAFSQRVALPGKAIPVDIKTEAAARAATDTITAHFVGATPILYPSGSGWVAGHNEFGDIAKMQKITTAGGAVTDLLFWFGAKEGNPASTITATIWSDSSGVPGTVLDTVHVPFSAIDTSMGGLVAIPNAAYNTVATFTPPVAIPTGNTIWAGFSVTSASGDSIGLVTSSDSVPGDAPGVTGDFANASTHTFEQWSDSTFHSFNGGPGTWQLDIALAVFPVINPGTGINESGDFVVRLFQNQPNPASKNTTIHYETAFNGNVNLKIFNVAGKEVMAINEGNKTAGKHRININTAGLSSGVYYYTLFAGDNSMTKKMILIE